MNATVCDICGEGERPYDLMRQQPTFHRLTHRRFPWFLGEKRIDLCPSCFGRFEAMCAKARKKAQDGNEEKPTPAGST